MLPRDAEGRSSQRPPRRTNYSSAETVATPNRQRRCAFCDESIEHRAAQARTCGERCQKAARRATLRRALPPPVRYPPGDGDSLRKAIHALDLGVPLKALRLDHMQTNLLKAIDRRFSAEQQFRAAHRIAEELFLYRFCTTGTAAPQWKRRGDEVDTRDVRCAVVVALRDSFGVCSSFPGVGRPLRYDWIPARAPWRVLIRHVKREVRKSFEQAKEARQADALSRASGPSLDEPFLVAENGDVTTYGETIGAWDVYPSNADEPREIGAPKGYSWQTYPGMFRRPSREWWLEKNEATGKLIHPPLTNDELKTLRAQLKGAPYPLTERLHDYQLEAAHSDAPGARNARPTRSDRAQDRQSLPLARQTADR
jgi:hypothetical protein